MNVIVIAVITLIVLIVMVFLFSGRADIFGEKIQSCSTVGGTCEPGNTCPSGFATVEGTNCEANNQICCTDLRYE